MADTILDFFAQFCKTLVIAFWYEDRVVAETFCAMLLGGDSTIYNTFKLVYFLDAGATTRTYILFLNITDNRAETGLTILLASQFSQQLGHICLAVVICTFCISGTMNTRSTIKSFYFQAGIISKTTDMVVVVDILCLL
ncbi:unknown [Prevotella sp. CAG:604]|nr:unknown [Prevotella sp. CAG:604]